MVMHFQNHQDFNLAKLKHLDGVLRKTVCPSNYFIFRAPGKARPALICPIFPGKVSVETGIYIGMGFHMKLMVEQNSSCKAKIKGKSASFVVKNLCQAFKTSKQPSRLTKDREQR